MLKIGFLHDFADFMYIINVIRTSKYFDHYSEMYKKINFGFEKKNKNIMQYRTELS